MASENFGIVTAIQFRASDEIYIRDVPISQIVSSYRVAMATGGGASLLQGGVDFADGASTVTPVTLRRLIAGPNITLTETANGIEVGGTIGGAGVAALSNQGLGIPVVYNPSGVLKTLQAGPNMSITEPTPGVLLFTAAMSGGGSGVLSLSNAGATGFSLIAGPTPSTTGQLKTLSAVTNHRLYIAEAANVLSIGLQLLSTGTGFSVVRDPSGTFNSLVPGAGINIANDGVGNLTISQALTSTGVSTGTFLTATNQSGTFPQARQLLGTVNQIVLTDNPGGNNMTVGFPVAAPPQTGFDPTVGNHLVRLSYLQSQLIQQGLPRCAYNSSHPPGTPLQPGNNQSGGFAPDPDSIVSTSILASPDFNVSTSGYNIDINYPATDAMYRLTFCTYISVISPSNGCDMKFFVQNIIGETQVGHAHYYTRDGAGGVVRSPLTMVFQFKLTSPAHILLKWESGSDTADADLIFSGWSLLLEKAF